MSQPPRERSSGKPQLVGDLLGSVLTRRGLAGKIEAASVLVDWESLVGPRISAVTRTQRVSDGVLFVAVENSPWLMELNLMKADLLRRINAGKGEGRIKQIIFVMGDPGPS